MKYFYIISFIVTIFISGCSKQEDYVFYETEIRGHKYLYLVLEKSKYGSRVVVHDPDCKKCLNRKIKIRVIENE